MPYTKKPGYVENNVENFIIISACDMTKHIIRTFTTIKQLQGYDRKFNELGYRLKNCDLYPAPKRDGGIALWHFDTDFELKPLEDSKSFKGIISTEGTDIKHLHHDSFADFDKDFTKLKQHHTLVGLSVTSSQLSLFTGE